MSGTAEVIRRRGELPVESVPCYLCGRTDGATLVDDPPFKVILCAGCGLAYTSPRIRADRLHEIYDLGYFESESGGDFGYTSYAEDAAGFRRTFEMKADIVSRVTPPGRVIEVGCAAGFFLKALQQRGYDVHGVEVSGSIVQYAREVMGLPHIFHGHLADYPGTPGSFDIALMWDVIEHLADPLVQLAQIRRLLKPGGHFFLQTQDVSSLTRHVLGSRWTHFKQLEHVLHFSPRTIRVLLDRAGFDVLRIQKRGAGKHLSVKFILERTKRFGVLANLLAQPLRLLGSRYLYVNPWDEIIVTARARPV